MKSAGEFTWCAERLRALAETERLRLVMALFQGPKHVGALAEELKDTIVKVSHHLGVLKHSGIVQSTKQGRFVEYALHPDVFIVAEPGDPAACIDLGCCRLELASARHERRGKHR